MNVCSNSHYGPKSRHRSNGVIIACLVATSLSCKTGTYEGSGTLANTAGKAPIQVNPMAFNAFKIWSEGTGIPEILSYPENYDQSVSKADGVFSVQKSDFLDTSGIQPKFIGVPTEGVEIKDGVLKYPVRNGLELRLRFVGREIRTSPAAVLQGNLVGQFEAAGICDPTKKLRLPTARELFDYCAAGVTGPNSARCGAQWPIWSASVLSKFSSKAWTFDPQTGGLFHLNERFTNFAVICVTAP